MKLRNASDIGCRSLGGVEKRIQVYVESSESKRRKQYMPPRRRCASQAGPVFSLGRSPSPRSRTLARSRK